MSIQNRLARLESAIDPAGHCSACGYPEQVCNVVNHPADHPLELGECQNCHRQLLPNGRPVGPFGPILNINVDHLM